MRKLLTCAALATVMAVGFAQTTQTVVTPDGNIVTFVQNNNLSYEDAAAAMAIARAYNMDPAAVLAARGTISAPFYQLAPAYMIQQQSGKPLSDIWNMYNNGMTWMQIANQLNVPATYYNPTSADTSNWNNDTFNQGVWQYMLQNNYAMTPDDFNYFTTNHVPMNEVVVGEVLSRQDNRPIRDVMTAYNGNNDWSALQNQFANTGVNNTKNDMTTQATSTTSTTTTSSSSTTTMPANGQANGSESTTTTSTMPVATDNFSVPANHHTQTVTANPIQEWQVNGGDIVAYNPGYAFTTTTHTSYGLSRRHHRHHRRHHRHHH